MPDEHSRLSPSSMSRILVCPGSAVDNPPDRSSAAAEEGTRAHTCAEQVLLRAEDIDYDNEEMLNGAKVYAAYVESHKADIGAELHVEQRLVSVSTPDHGGTIDCVLVGEDTLHVVDYKYGVFPVSPHNNKQLLSYLVLAREHFGAKKNYLASIVQPRVYGDPQCATYTEDDLDGHELDVVLVSEDDTREAGDHCKWCPLLKTCSVAYQAAEHAAKESFDDEWDAPKCLRMLEVSGMVAELAKEAKKRMTALLKGGENIEGWKLVRSLGNRKWKDEDKVQEHLEELFEDESVYLETKLISPAKLEKVCKGYAPFVADNTSREDKGAMLAPASSRLEDYDPTDVFEVIL